jgi:hypothetical protein
MNLQAMATVMLPPAWGLLARDGIPAEGGFLVAV